jgi:hypothetical protein
MRDKVFAQWVANNVMNEYFISNEVPKKEKKTGKMKMAGIDWSWERENTDQAKDFFQVKVRVSKGQDVGRYLSVLTTFVSKNITYCPPATNSGNNGSNVGAPASGVQSGNC